MFLDDLKTLIKRLEALEIENRLLNKEIKRLHQSDEVKRKKKVKTSLENKETPSLF